MNEFKFNCGDVVRDRITGFEGVVIGRTQWIINCNTYMVKCRVLKDGIPQESQHFDEPNLEQVTANALKEVQTRKTGGPTVDTPRQHNI